MVWNQEKSTKLGKRSSIEREGPGHLERKGKKQPTGALQALVSCRSFKLGEDGK